MSNLAEVLDYYADDYPGYAEDYLRIRARDQTIRPLSLNYAQRVAHEILEKQRKEKGFVRAIILKARRLGMSTYIEGRYYHRASLKPNQNVYIVAHRDDSCETLFQMTKMMQKENILQPPTEASNRKELRFSGLNSQYAFSSADSPDASRSRDITLFHGSEMAFWRSEEELFTALMECLPSPGQGYSEATVESTANGYGNLYQRMVFRAWAEGRYPYFEKDGYVYAYHNPEPDEQGNVTDWILLFFPWFSLPDNTMAFDAPQTRDDYQRVLEVPVYRRDLGRSGPSEERELQVKERLTAEQLNWRRWTIANKHNGNLKKFKQENPATIPEAFISTGGNVFSAELCDDMEKNCRPPAHEGTLVERQGKVVVRRMANGPMRVWELPNPDFDYLVTVDPAGGNREHQSDKNEPDYTTMDVWKRDNRFLIQVAQWHGHIDYDLCAEEAILLARLYLGAAIAVLRMNHGLTVLATLKREVWPRIILDQDGQPGILESAKSKPMMVDGLVCMCRDGFMHIQSAETVAEARTFIERDRKLGAEDGCKDDRVSSAYCASEAHGRMPYPADVVRSRRKNKGTPRSVIWEKHLAAKRQEQRRP